MNVNEIPYVIAKCAIITVIIEFTFALIIGIRDKKDLINVILVNVLTNPIAVSVEIYINMYYGLTARNIYIAIVEVVIVLIEGMIYSKTLKYKKMNPILISLILNGLSYLAGLFL